MEKMIRSMKNHMIAIIRIKIGKRNKISRI